jgi:hypothetical protein
VQQGNNQENHHEDNDCSDYEGQESKSPSLPIPILHDFRAVRQNFTSQRGALARVFTLQNRIERKSVQARIFEAETAVLARCREVFYGNGTAEEKDTLKDALYALRAFRAAFEHTEAAEAA